MDNEVMENGPIGDSEESELSSSEKENDPLRASGPARPRRGVVNVNMSSDTSNSPRGPSPNHSFVDLGVMRDQEIILLPHEDDQSTLSYSSDPSSISVPSSRYYTANNSSASGCSFPFYIMCSCSDCVSRREGGISSSANSAIYSPRLPRPATPGLFPLGPAQPLPPFPTAGPTRNQFEPQGFSGSQNQVSNSPGGEYEYAIDISSTSTVTFANPSAAAPVGGLGVHMNIYGSTTNLLFLGTGGVVINTMRGGATTSPPQQQPQPQPQRRNTAPAANPPPSPFNASGATCLPQSEQQDQLDLSPATPASLDVNVGSNPPISGTGRF